MTLRLLLDNVNKRSDDSGMLTAAAVLRAGSVTDGMRAVFVELLVHGPLSRAEVARRVALSPSALTKLTKPLIEAGFLQEEPASGGNPIGRPSQPLSVQPTRMSFLGVKLTGEELFAVRTDLLANVQARFRAPLLSQDPRAVVDHIAEAVGRLGDGHSNIGALGVSLAGTASPGDPVVHTSPFLGWSQTKLGTLVEEATGVPTVLENDVRALTAAQQWFGAGVGRRTFALVTVGAGVGCGLVIGDQLVTGSRATGLVGHLAIDDRGPICETGHRGCARAFISSSSISRAVGAALGATDLTFDMCLELAREGQPVARRVLDDAGRALGQVVATVANVVGPELVILSGEAVGMYEFCADAFNESLATQTHWTSTPVDVVVIPFTFDEWARGAAVTALQYQLSRA